MVTGFLSETSKIGVGKEVYSLEVSPEFLSYSGVEIVADEETSYFAGNDINRVLRIENPWGTQEQAETILASLQAVGFQYQPFKASSAILNPAAEIGDGITVSDTYSGIYKMDRTFSTLMSADIEAPQDEEIDHEYPFESKQDRIYKREIADAKAQISITQSEISTEVSRATTAEEQLQSAITQTADEISANVVKKTGGSQDSFGWSLTDSAWSVSSNGSEVFRIDNSGANVSGTIRATSGEIGGFTIGNYSLYNGMNNIGSKDNGVYIGTDGISVGGGKFTVTANGAVSAVDMVLTGTLRIGGADIAAKALRSGAQSAYTNSSAWTTGAGYGVNYNNATKQNGGSYPNFYRASYLYCDTIRAETLITGGVSRGLVWRYLRAADGNYYYFLSA